MSDQPPLPPAVDAALAALDAMTHSLPAKPGADPVQADPPSPSAGPSVIEQREAWMRQALPHLLGLMKVAAAPEFPTPHLRATLHKAVKHRRGECDHENNGTPSTIHLAWMIDSAPLALQVMLHELIHAAMPMGTAHKKPFRQLAQALGFVPGTGDGPESAATPELKRRLEEIAAKLPAWPADTVPPKPPKKGKAKGGQDDEADELADIANATRFINDHRGRIFHRPSVDAKHRAWYIWDGMRWKRDECNQILNLAVSTAKAVSAEYIEQARHYSTEANEAAKNPEKAEQAKALRMQAAHWRSKAESMQKLKTMENFIALASSNPQVNIDQADLDRHSYFLNCTNGTVDMRNGQVYPHDPKHLITRLCPVDYVPGLSDERLSKILHHVCRGDTDVVTYVQDVLGRSIFGDNDLEQFWLWWGPGRSGKGTLMEAVKAVLGDYAMTAEFQSFIKTQGARVRDDLDRLREARFVLASEVEKGEQMAAGVVKAMTGGDTISARALHGTYREFKPRMTLHLQCNDRPRVDDRDSGLWGRMVVIPCGDTVPKEKRDPAIKRHLQDPKTGGRAVLSWLVAGAIRTHALPRLKEPKAVVEATAEYRQDQDPTRVFFVDHLRFALPVNVHKDGSNTPKTMCWVKDLMDAYTEYATTEHLNQKFRLSLNGIGERLEAKGCYRRKVRNDQGVPTNAWVGVTIPAESHAFRMTTFTPTEKEHREALGLPPDDDGSVPPFRRSADLKSPPHVGAQARTPTRARPGDESNSLDSQEQRNRGTDSKPPDEPANGRPINLGDLW